MIIIGIMFGTYLSVLNMKYSTGFYQKTFENLFFELDEENIRLFFLYECKAIRNRCL